MLNKHYEFPKLFSDFAYSNLAMNQILAVHLNMVHENHGGVCSMCMRWKENIDSADVFHHILDEKIILIPYSICVDCEERAKMDPEGAMERIKENIMTAV